MRKIHTVQVWKLSFDDSCFKYGGNRSVFWRLKLNLPLNIPLRVTNLIVKNRQRYTNDKNTRDFTIHYTTTNYSQFPISLVFELLDLSFFSFFSLFFSFLRRFSFFFFVLFFLRVLPRASFSIKSSLTTSSIRAPIKPLPLFVLLRSKSFRILSSMSSFSFSSSFSSLED